MRQRDIETERHRDRETDKQINRERHRERERERYVIKGFCEKITILAFCKVIYLTLQI